MMKKSQILAAIALAMALGVIAPVSSASAKVSDLDASQASSVSKSIDDAVNALVETADKIGTSIDENITNATTGAKVQLRASEKSLYDAVTATANAVAVAENGAISALRTALGNVNAKANTDLGTTTTYKDVTSAINSEIVAQKAIVNNDKATPVQRQTADGNVKDLEAALGVAETAIVAAINGTNGVADVITALGVFVKTDGFKTEDDGKYSVATYNSIMTAVNKVPKYTLFAALFNAKDEAKKALSTDTTSVTYAEARKAIADLEDAIKAFGVSTPETPNLPSEGDVTAPNAPATGIAGTAEGTATTVSIVAGLATALTALGAGVVAYRSARRK